MLLKLRLGLLQPPDRVLALVPPAARLHRGQIRLGLRLCDLALPPRCIVVSRRRERTGKHYDGEREGYRRGGCGYDKRVRALADSKLLSNADRALLNTYGVNGGGPGNAYGITIRDGDGAEQTVAGMSDNVAVKAGSVVRITTPGGGGWA